jgi:hypothetical protein
LLGLFIIADFRSNLLSSVISFLLLLYLFKDLNSFWDYSFAEILWKNGTFFDILSPLGLMKLISLPLESVIFSLSI